jgi:hypothetical protein
VPTEGGWAANADELGPLAEILAMPTIAARLKR